MKINNPIRIAVFLSIVIFAFAIILFSLITDNFNTIYSFIAFFFSRTDVAPVFPAEPFAFGTTFFLRW